MSCGGFGRKGISCFANANKSVLSIHYCMRSILLKGDLMGSCLTVYLLERLQPFLSRTAIALQQPDVFADSSRSLRAMNQIPASRFLVVKVKGET